MRCIWYEVKPGVRKGALADELNYFVTCIVEKTPPTIITPEESLTATQACLAAEASAASGQVISVQDFN
jgi:predicted dehydrogenase